jgi:hypothetical protein
VALVCALQLAEDSLRITQEEESSIAHTSVVGHVTSTGAEVEDLESVNRSGVCTQNKFLPATLVQEHSRVQPRLQAAR